MSLSLLYQAFGRVLQLIRLTKLRDTDLAVEIVMLRHEVAVLRRQLHRPALEPADRAARSADDHEGQYHSGPALHEGNPQWGFHGEIADHNKSAKFLIRDRDTKFPASFDTAFAAEGTWIIKSPVRRPRAKPSVSVWWAPDGASVLIGRSFSAAAISKPSFPNTPSTATHTVRTGPSASSCRLPTVPR